MSPVKDRPRDATQGTDTQHTNQISTDKNSVTRLPPCIFSEQVRAIALMHPNERLGAITALAKQFNFKMEVVHSAVSVEVGQLEFIPVMDEYQPHLLPAEYRRWAPGTEHEMARNNSLKDWVIISSRYYVERYAPSHGTGLLQLPDNNDPSDFRWPVHGCKVLCLLGVQDLVKAHDLFSLLFSFGAISIDARIKDNDGSELIKSYKNLAEVV